MYERRALSLIAAACRWPLLLLSLSLSAQPRLPGGGPCLTLSVKGACPHDAYEKHCGRRVKTMHEIGEWQWRRVTGHPFGHAAGTTGDDLIRVVVMYQAACGSL